VCAGPIVVKAVVLTAVERLHAAGYGKMYTGLPSTITEVGSPALSWLLLKRSRDRYSACSCIASRTILA